MQAAAFLDRDGVLNADHGYVYQWECFEWLPEAIAGMQRLATLGYALVVTTNQSGIARGYYTEDDFWRLTARMEQSLGKHGVTLAGVYYCPHHPDGAVTAYRQECQCRKPKPGMIMRAAEALAIDVSESLMVGDKPSDMAAAAAAGITKRYHLTAGEPTPNTIKVRSITDVADHLMALRVMTENG